jgi:hypothetical protein
MDQQVKFEGGEIDDRSVLQALAAFEVNHQIMGGDAVSTYAVGHTIFKA